MSQGAIFLKTEILSVLKTLEKKYNEVYYLPATAQNKKLIKAYSKMALISFCGWLEDGMRDLVKMTEIRLIEQKNRDKLSGMVKGIYGFSYSGHFSKAIIFAFGIHGLENIENDVGDGDIAKISSILGVIKTWRDDSAHSHRATISWDPSRVISEFNNTWHILKKIEKSTRRYRDKKIK